MPMTPLTVPFAHLIEPYSLEFLQDEIDSDVWDRMHEVFETLAPVPFHGTPGVGAFYVVFSDPNDRSKIELMHADQLYARYVAEFYNEEIHLITPKQ